MEGEVEMSERQDDAARVDPSGVEVHSVCGVEETLEILEDIKQAGARAASAAAAQGVAPARETTGTHNVQQGGPSKTEFEQLVLRVQKSVAKPVLRKLFFCKHTCNMMQEIWIQDKSNPDAKQDPAKPHKKWDPLKEYAIVHLHYHGHNVSRAEERHTELVDAVNVRHLAATPGKYYQQDNPFFETSIEPSGGNTLKVYPDKDWKCNAGSCGALNPPSKAVCLKCKQGARPCVHWNWKKDPKLGNDGIYKILEEAGKTELWLAGVGSGVGPIQKSVKRGGAGGTTGDDSGGTGLRLGDLLERYTQRFKGVGASVGAHGGSAAAGGAVQPGVSLLSAEAGESLREGGSALHGSAGFGSEEASCDGGPPPPPHVGDQLVQGEWIEDERDGWSGEDGEQQADAVERPADWPASLKMVWRDEVKAALELMSDTDDAYAWPSADGNAGEGYGAAATRELKFTDWKKFCGDVRRKRMVPTCIIDFPYTDGKSLQDPLLERMYCFKDADEDRRVVLHVHTVLPWCNRGTEPKKRATKVTSVNVRHAEGKGGVFKQEKGDVSMGVVPVEDKLKKSWKTLLKEGKGARLEWQWGTAKSMPMDEKNNLSATVSAYDEVREIIKLGESLLDTEAPAETYSPSETEKKIRGGGFEVVGVAMRVGGVQSGDQQGAEADAVERLVAGLSLGVERPDPPPSPFTVLFVGANVEKQTVLNLRDEVLGMEKAFYLQFGVASWKGFVEFEHDCDADATSIMEQIMGCEPTVLHIACHGEPEGVHLKGGYLASTDLADSILAVNDELGARRIRLAIANACMSGELARKLSEGIEFVIHHGEVSVGDANAVKFSSTLFRGLGRGLSLWASFKAANLSSKPYKLLAPRFDPKQFFLQGSLQAGTAQHTGVAGGGGAAAHSPARGGQEAAHVAAGLSRSTESEKVRDDRVAQKEARWSELVEHLARHDIDGIEERLRDDGRLRVRTVFHLGELGESDLAAIEWLSIVDRRTLVRICQEEAAKRMSGADTDDARSQVSNEATPSEPGDLAPVEGGWTVLGFRHDGDVAEFQLHMKQLVVEFVFGEQQRGTFWQLLMAAFMRHADFDWGRDSEQPWLVFGQSASGQMESLESFEQTLQSEAMHHPWLEEWGFDKAKRGFLKTHKHRCAVWVLDQMVRKFECHAEEAGAWEREVMDNWFESDEDSPPLLDRANKFLGERASVRDILGQAIETHSYCAFLVVSKLTAMLFFEDLAAQKRHANAVQGAKFTVGGFRLFVSSDGQVFGVAERDIPSRRSLGVVLKGLRCLAGLPRESLEGMLVRLKVGGGGGGGEVGEQEARAERLKHHDPWAAGPGDRERAAIERAQRVRKLYGSRELGDYLAEAIKSAGQLKDTITGEVLDVLAACVQLKVVQQQSVHLITDQEKETLTVQEGFMCPLSRRLMEDPVVCCDGKTYDRRYISTWFAGLQQIGSKLKSPMTNEVLDSDEMTPNVEVRQAIEKLKKETGHEELRRTYAEGEEEKRAWQRRRGYLDEADAASNDSKESLDVMKLLAEHDSGVCIYGAPASGKTVSMLQITTIAATDALKHLQKGLAAGGEANLLQGGELGARGGARDQPMQGRDPGELGGVGDVPRVPLFIRAAELSKLLREHGAPEDGDMVRFFIQHSIQGAGPLLSSLYDAGQLLILVDGLDEGAEKRRGMEDFFAELLPKCGGLATPGTSALVVSTREKNFHESVSQNRLTTFARAQIQPLDEGGRQKLVEHQLGRGARADLFVECLKSMDVPDMVRSPFLLSLLVNVFKEKGEIPRRRNELYREQALCVLRRAAARGGALAQSLGGADELVKVGFEFLECLAFVCHMDLKTRDFSLGDEDFRAGLARWQNTRASLGEIEAWVFEGGSGSLLCCTDIENKGYRFGHLTVQEFLAASFLNRLSTSDSLFRLWVNPVCASWFHEVLRLASTMMDTDVFTTFSLFVLGQEDGSGAFCEVVNDMVQERVAQREPGFAVEEALAKKFRSIRPFEAIVTMLSHPSADLRAMTLKETSRFHFLADVGELSGRLLDSVEAGEATTAVATARMCSALLSVCQLDSPSDEVESVFRRTLQIAIAQTVTAFPNVVHEAAVTAVGTFFMRFGSKHEGFIDVVTDLFDSESVTEARRKVLMHLVFDLGLVHERLVVLVLASGQVQPLFDGMDKSLSDWLLQIPRPTNVRISALLLDMEEAGELRADQGGGGSSGLGTSEALGDDAAERPARAALSPVSAGRAERAHGEEFADLEEDGPSGTAQSVSGTREEARVDDSGERGKSAAVDDSGDRAGGDDEGAEAGVVVERDFRAGLADLDARMVSLDVSAGQFAPLWQKMFNSREDFADDESAELFQCLFKLNFPGIERGSLEWDAEVTRTWRLPNLGRWAFSAVLQNVRDSCKAEQHPGSSAGQGWQGTAIAAAAKEVCRQQQGVTSQLKVEAELLLKELGIGRRAREIEAWSGVVSAVEAVAYASAEEEASSGEVAGGGDVAQACIIEHQPPRQAEDAEEGKKLLEADGKALLNAAWIGDLTKVRQLIACGADVNIADEKGGKTPLHWAALQGHAAVVEQLLAAGAEKDAPDGVGWSPLHWAARQGHAAVVEQLLAAGAKKDATDWIEQTPLHWAASGGHAAVVEQLLAAGAEKDAKNKLGETPLHWAASGGHAAVVEQLLAAGAEKDATDGRGQTPLQVAVHEENEKVAKILREAGARE